MELKLVPKDEWESTIKSENLQEGFLRYAGPDRRKAARRITVDRRAMVRFENVPDRRQNGDQRLGTRIWSGREF